jgi:DNA-binding IclR family transcriptional regulator
MSRGSGVWLLPIETAVDDIVAGISLSATRPFMPKDRMQALVPVMKSAAREISVKLGYRQG